MFDHPGQIIGIYSEQRDSVVQSETENMLRNRDVSRRQKTIGPCRKTTTNWQVENLRTGIYWSEKMRSVNLIAEDESPKGQKDHGGQEEG